MAWDTTALCHVCVGNNSGLTLADHQIVKSIKQEPDATNSGQATQNSANQTNSITFRFIQTSGSNMLKKCFNGITSTQLIDMYYISNLSYLAHEILVKKLARYNHSCGLNFVANCRFCQELGKLRNLAFGTRKCVKTNFPLEEFLSIQLKYMMSATVA